MDSNHTFLAVISLDSALNKDRNYYSKVLLKECKYIEKEKEKNSDKEQIKTKHKVFEIANLIIYF